MYYNMRKSSATETLYFEKKNDKFKNYQIV